MTPAPARALPDLRDPGLLVLLLGALLAKGVVLAQLHAHALLQPEGALDTAVYVGLAHRVASGDVLLGPEPYFVAPLYVYFLASVFAASGASLLAAKAIQILLGVAAVGLVYATGRQWGSPRAARTAAILAAGTGVLTFNEAVLLQSALDPFLSALDLFLLARALAGPRGSRFLATGVVLGLHALNRPNVLLWILALAALAALGLRREGGWRFAAALLLGAALTIGPVTARNWLVSREAILISSHGGLNFYIGNNAEADGTYRSVPGLRPDIRGQVEDARRLVETALGRPASMREVDDYFYTRAWEWIRAHPREAGLLLLRKLACLVNATDLSLNYSYAYYSREEPTLLRVLLLGPGLLFPLGLLGLWIRARSSDDFWIWAAFVPVYGLSVAAFFVSSRYRLPLLLPLCVGAGLALDRFLRCAREGRWGFLLGHALAACLLAVFSHWNLGLDDGRSNERTALLLHLVESGRYEEARERLARVEAEHPQPGFLHFRLGQALLAQARPSDAAERFRRALEIEPGRLEIRLGLGQALLDAGKAEEAIPHLRAAREAGVRPDVAGFDLARALAGLGRRDEAVTALRDLPVPTEANGLSLAALGQLALELREGSLAETFLREAVARAPGAAATQEALGLALALQGRHGEAIRVLEEARRLDPASASAHLNLAVALAQAGRADEARARAEEALRLRPDYTQARGLIEALGRRR